jgi:hypothetical protein
MANRFTKAISLSERTSGLSEQTIYVEDVARDLHWYRICVKSLPWAELIYGVTIYKTTLNVSWPFITYHPRLFKPSSVISLNTFLLLQTTIVDSLLLFGDVGNGIIWSESGASGQHLCSTNDCTGRIVTLWEMALNINKSPTVNSGPAWTIRRFM